jgi:hypothetical protein
MAHRSSVGGRIHTQEPKGAGAPERVGEVDALDRRNRRAGDVGVEQRLRLGVREEIGVHGAEGIRPAYRCRGRTAGTATERFGR